MAAGVEVEELADAIFVLEKVRLLAPSSLVRGFRLGDPRGAGEGEISSEVSRAVRMVGVTRCAPWVWGKSVAAGQFGEVYGQPAVVREVVELDIAEEARGDRLGSELPRPRISAEFEARRGAQRESREEAPGEISGYGSTSDAG